MCKVQGRNKGHDKGGIAFYGGRRYEAEPSSDSSPTCARLLSHDSRILCSMLTMPLQYKAQYASAPVQYASAPHQVVQYALAPVQQQYAQQYVQYAPQHMVQQQVLQYVPAPVQQEIMSRPVPKLAWDVRHSLGAKDHKGRIC
jgi:hypothetical protein